MTWLHVHWDRNWQTDGIFAFHQCRCGARRTVWISRRRLGPVPAGWPPLADRHGLPVRDSGWRKP